MSWIVQSQAASRQQTHANPTTTALPPVVLLGGDANALAAARSLGRLGAKVYAINDPDAAVRFSRYSQFVSVPVEGDREQAWTTFLLGPDSNYLAGSVLLGFCDAALQVLAGHRQALLQKFKLDLCNPAAQMTLLNKLSTYRAAVEAGIPTPKFWVVESRSQVISLRESLVYPLILKPLLAHRAKKQFGRKHERVASFEELLSVLESEHAAGVEVLLMEFIPGSDDRLCSYYTYLDETCTPQFDFTKRIIRRFPPGMGPACYHITDWVPQIVTPARTLFQHAGLQGLANVEFKLDERDGQYKLIECNARFTGANSLVAASGLDLSAYVYRRLVGLPQPPLKKFGSGVRLLDPAIDCLSFLKLRKAGALTLGGWIASLMHPQTFAYFCWTDPLPALSRALKLMKMAIRRWRASRLQDTPERSKIWRQPAAPASEVCALPAADPGPS